VILLLPVLAVGCFLAAAVPINCFLAYLARRLNPPTAVTVPLDELLWIGQHRKPSLMHRFLNFLSDYGALLGMVVFSAGMCLFAKFSPDSFQNTSVDNFELPRDADLIDGHEPAGREVASHRAGAA